jgi:hypothetical protein
LNTNMRPHAIRAVGAHNTIKIVSTATARNGAKVGSGSFVSAKVIDIARAVSTFFSMTVEIEIYWSRLHNSSGNFAIFTAIRRASSLVSSLAADRRPARSRNRHRQEAAFGHRVRRKCRRILKRKKFGCVIGCDGCVHCFVTRKKSRSKSAYGSLSLTPRSGSK